MIQNGHNHTHIAISSVMYEAVAYICIRTIQALQVSLELAQQTIQNYIATTNKRSNHMTYTCSQEYRALHVQYTFPSSYKLPTDASA